MSQQIPAIRDYMTKSPTTVATGASIAEAAAIMSERRIRHLPVVDAEGAVRGMLSERDVALLEGLEGLDPKSLMVAVAMSNRPYTCAPGALVSEVAGTMAEHKYGSCVVVHKGKVVGVFTTVDACRALSEAYAR